MSKFSLPKKESDFINEPLQQEEAFQKEKRVPFLLNIPQSLHDNIEKIHRINRVSKTSICVDLLIPAVKQKLKELKSD